MTRTLALVLAVASLGWTPIPSAVSPEVPLAEPTVHVPQTSEAADIASDGESFFVVSTEYVVSGAHHHLAMLLDERGEPRLSESEHLTSRGGWRPAVAWSGRVYLAVWDEFSETLGMRFSREGRPIDRAPIRIRASVRSLDLPPYAGFDRDVAWDGTHFVVITESSPGAFVAARVDEGGRVVANGLPAAGSRIAVRNGVSVLVGGTRHGAVQSEVAAGDDDFFVVTVTAGMPLRGQFLDASGQPKGSEIVLASEGREPAVTWDGARYVVAFTTGDQYHPEVRAVRVGLDAEPFLVAKDATTPALATNGRRVLITWSPWTMFGSLQRAFLDEIEPEPVHRWPNTRDSMLMTRAGANTLVAWFEHDRAYNGQVRIQPVRDGVPLPAKTIAGSRPVAFASNGAEALLVVMGEMNRTSRIIRVDSMANVLSDVTLADTLPWDTADLVWTGEHYLYVWREYLPASQIIEIRAVRISADGALLDDRGKALVSGSSFDLGSPFLAVAGDRTLLVVSAQLRQVVETHFVSADLFVTPADVVPIGEAFAFDLVSDGTGFLLVYARRGTVTGPDTIVWQKLAGDGRLGPSGEVRLTAKHEYHSALRAFWTGENYLLVWSRVAAQRRELQAMRVSPEGAAIDAPQRIFAEPVPATTMEFWKTAMHLAEPRRLELAYVDWRELGQYEQTAVFRSFGPARRRAVR